MLRKLLAATLLSAVLPFGVTTHTSAKEPARSIATVVSKPKPTPSVQATKKPVIKSEKKIVIKPIPKTLPDKQTANPNPSPLPSATPPVTPAPPITQYAFGALKFMRANLGKPYVLGGVGPEVYDCSGLIQAAWRAAGVSLPRISGQQFLATVRIQYEDLQPGDLVFFGPSGTKHVGMYLGDDKMLDAANPRRDVTISDLTQDWYKKNLAGYGRVPATDI